MLRLDVVCKVKVALMMVTRLDDGRSRDLGCQD